MSLESFKICEDYGVPNDPMRKRDDKFYWIYQHGVRWPNDYIGPDSMTRWIIKNQMVLQMWDYIEYWRVSGLMHIYL